MCVLPSLIRVSCTQWANIEPRRGEFDWVLALYHDQGLIAVKTAICL